MNDRASITLTSLTASYLIIATAAAITIAWVLKDWTLFIPTILVEGGCFAVAVAFSSKGKAENARRFSDANYTMFWGNLLIILGVLWVVNYEYPDNMIAILIAFMVWLGLAILLFSIRKRR